MAQSWLSLFTFSSGTESTIVAPALMLSTLMLSALMLIATALVALALTAFTAQSVVWGDGIEGEISWGESLNLSNYTLTAEDFFSGETKRPGVLVEVRQGEDAAISRVMAVGDGFELNDSLKVDLEAIEVESLELNKSRAKIRMRSPAEPELSVVLTPDKDRYLGGDDIHLDLRVENTGIVDAEDLSVDVDLGNLAGESRHRKDLLRPGEVWTKDDSGDPLRITIKAPYLPEPANVELTADAKFSDPDGGIHHVSGATFFWVEGQLKLSKRVDELQRIGKRYWAIDTIRNIGRSTLQVRLEDSCGPHFSSDADLTRELIVLPGKMETFSYLVEAVKPGLNLSVPAAEVSYSFGNKTYRAVSNSPLVDVVGPFIEARLSVDPEIVVEGENIEVLAEVENSGNRFAGVSLFQAVPEWASLAQGEIDRSLKLGPGEKASFSYTLICREPGRCELSPMVVDYRDVEGNELSSKSNSVCVQVKEREVLAPISNNTTSENASLKKVSKGKEASKTTDGPQELQDPKEFSWLLLVIVLLISLLLSRHP